MADDFSVQVSYRFGRTNRYGEPMDLINLRADDAPELAALLDEFKAVLGEITTVGELLAAVDTVAQVAGAVQDVPPSQAQGTVTAGVSAAAVQGDGRQCAHGLMIYKSGISRKNNKPWARYDCPIDGAPGACASQWANNKA